MATYTFHQAFANQADTENFARRLAPLVTAGDTILLSGDIGAGKSVFARSLILAKLDTPEDVPSPTFTIIQTYEAADTEIWHCDLYRLTDISQTDELGLEFGFENALCLIEWPEILGTHVPSTSLRITAKVQPDQGTRIFEFAGPEDIWMARINEALS